MFTPDIPKSQELDFITSTQAAIKSPEDLYNTSAKLNPGFQAEVKSIADNLGLEKAPKFKMSGGKTIDVDHFKLTSKDMSIPKEKRLDFDIWYDNKNSMIVKVTYSRMGNWEYRLKNFE